MSSTPVTERPPAVDLGAADLNQKWSAYDVLRVTTIVLALLTMFVGVAGLVGCEEFGVFKTIWSGIGLTNSCIILGAGFVTTVIACCCRTKTAIDAAEEKAEREARVTRNTKLNDFNTEVQKELGLERKTKYADVPDIYRYTRVLQWVKHNGSNKVEFLSKDQIPEYAGPDLMKPLFDKKWSEVEIEYVVIAMGKNGTWTLQWGGLEMNERGSTPRHTTKRGLTNSQIFTHTDAIKTDLKMVKERDIAADLNAAINHMEGTALRDDARVRLQKSVIAELNTITSNKNDLELEHVKFYFAVQGSRLLVTPRQVIRRDNPLHFHGKNNHYHYPDAFIQLYHLMKEIPLEEHLRIECLALVRDSELNYHMVAATTTTDKTTADCRTTGPCNAATLRSNFKAANLPKDMTTFTTSFGKEGIDGFVTLTDNHLRRNNLENRLRYQVYMSAAQITEPYDLVEIYYMAQGNGKTSKLGSAPQAGRISADKDIYLPNEIMANIHDDEALFPISVRKMRYEFVLIARQNQGPVYHLIWGSVDGSDGKVQTTDFTSQPKQSIQPANLVAEIEAAKKDVPLFNGKLTKNKIERMMQDHRGINV